MTNYLDLPAPHGFLVWQGKQTAIPTIEPLELKEYIITSNDEAFGQALLSDPAQMKVSEFHKEMWQDEHRTLPEERRLYFPDAETIYVYRIIGFERYNELKPIENGKMVDPEPLTDSERAMIEQAKKLPKTIILDKEAVTFDGEQFCSRQDCADLKAILKATYQVDARQVDDPQPLPLYHLALVRAPNIRLKKRNAVKQEGDNMPWEKVQGHPDCPTDEAWAVVKTDDGSLEGCHATEDEANAQLAALNASEADASEHDDEEKQAETKQGESVLQFVDRVHEHFMAAFKNEDRFGIVSTPQVRDIFDSHIIAEENGVLFRVNYMDTGGGEIAFAPRTAWAAVEMAYIDKAATHLKSFELPEDETDADDTPWLDKLKQAAKTILEFVTFSDVTESTTDLPAFDFEQPCGVAVKDVDGQTWHFTWSTNAFEDREGEIFSTKALEDYVAESWKREDKGTFDFWHIPGSDFAAKEWQGVIGRFLVEAGPYTENEIGQRAKEFFKQYPESHPAIAPEGWGASPEFRFLPEDRADSIYDWLWITRTSTLPKAAAANIHTEGKQIMLSEDQEKAAVEIFGQPFVQNLVEQGKQKTEDLEAAGVAHKEAGDPEEEVNEVEEETTEDEETEQAEAEAVKTIDLDLDALAEALGKQMNLGVNLEVITKAVTEVAEQVTALSARMDKIEKTEAVKQQAETPRYMFNLIRASEAVETAIDEKDALNEQKPKESMPQSSVASALFAK